MQRKSYGRWSYLGGSVWVATVAIGLTGSGQAQASLTIGVGSTTVAPGGSGFVEITLQNTGGSASTSIGGFSVVFASSNVFVRFTSASMAPTASYLLAGNSGDTPGVGVAITGNNTTSGLGRIFFTASGGASAGMAPITLSTDGSTNLTDSGGITIWSTSTKGTITLRLTGVAGRLRGVA